MACRNCQLAADDVACGVQVQHGRVLLQVLREACCFDRSEDGGLALGLEAPQVQPAGLTMDICSYVASPWHQRITDIWLM